MNLMMRSRVLSREAGRMSPAASRRTITAVQTVFEGERLNLLDRRTADDLLADVEEYRPARTTRWRHVPEVTLKDGAANSV
jgi:hypothetical protein